MIEIVSSMLASAGVSAAAIWFARTWISERIKNSIKHEYDLALEANKNVLKAQSDKEIEILKAQLKGESDVAAEKLKHELQRVASEHQIRFAQLHEKTADTLATIYSLLQALFAAVAQYTKILESSSEPSKAERRKNVAEAMGAFRDYFVQKRIYIPKSTAEKIVAFENRLFELAQDFRYGVEEKGDSRQPDRDTWSKVYNAMSKEVPELFAALEHDFQSLLGMPQPTKS